MGLGCGRIKLFLNVATDQAPAFDAGSYLQEGPPGSKVELDVGAGASPAVIDYDNDGRRDLICGASNGKLRFYRNEGTDAAPDFDQWVFIQSGGQILYVPSGRSSPVVGDLDGDGRKDILSGCAGGAVFLYLNVGTDAQPVFSGYEMVESDGHMLKVPAGRSRPWVCDWNDDGLLDLLCGGASGRVHLYRGLERILTLCTGDAGACPCGNPGAAGEGCANSTGAGALLAATGSTRVSEQGGAPLLLEITQGPPNQPCIWLQGGVQAASLPAHDGLLCLGNPRSILGLGVLDAGGALSTADPIHGFDLLNAALACGDDIAAEGVTTRYYQVWFRDALGPCGAGGNVSSALRVTWTP